MSSSNRSPSRTAGGAGWRLESRKPRSSGCINPFDYLIRIPVYFVILSLVGCKAGLFIHGTQGPDADQASETAPPSASGAASLSAAAQCGGPPVMYVLLIGTDSRADNYSGGLADSIRVIRVDFADPGLSYLAFPRDLYVEIPDLSTHLGIRKGKLNQAYLYGSPGIGHFDGDGQGPGLLALTLERNYGVKIDHYVAVNLRAFVRIVDWLGGLDIDLPYTIDGRPAGSHDESRIFRAGRLHLNGYRTMLLARMQPEGDLERSRTQDLILGAFAEKLLSPGMLPKLPGLVESLYGWVQTDLDVSEAHALVCLASHLDPGAIQARALPDSALTGTQINDPLLDNTFIWSADTAEVRKYVRMFNEGAWPAVPTPTSTVEP